MARAIGRSPGKPNDSAGAFRQDVHHRSPFLVLLARRFQGERRSSFKRATVDFELAKLFPSPAGHIELACFPLGGGNARGSLDGVATGFSARGPQQPNYAFGSPRSALQELFKSVSTDRKARTQYQLDRKVLEFIAGNESAIANHLIGIEKSKVQNYADSVESIRDRNRKIDAMADGWTREQKDLCLAQTADSFKFGGALLQHISRPNAAKEAAKAA